MIRNWLKVAVANYKRNWLAAVINLLGLSLGLTCLILAMVNYADEASYEQWNPNKKNIYYVQQRYVDGDYNNNVTLPMMMGAKAKIPEVQAYLLCNGSDDVKFQAANGKTNFTEGVYAMSHDFTDVIPFKKLAGNYKDALADTNSIIISDKLSKILFGTVNSVGQRLKSENSNFIIKAVYEYPKQNTAVQANAITLIKRLKDDEGQWGNNNYSALIMLKPGTDPRMVESRMYKDVIYPGRILPYSKQGKISVAEYVKKYGPAGVQLTRLDEMRLHAKNSSFLWESVIYKDLMIQLVLGGLIVLLSCVNFINLNTAIAVKRAKEVGVRKALGAGKGAIITQLMLETAVICVAALLISLAAANALLPVYAQLVDKTITTIPAGAVTAAIAVTLLVSLLAGILPAVYAANYKPIQTLKGNYARSSTGTLLRNGILGLQLVISSFFLIAGIIIYKQVSYMSAKDVGVKTAQVVVIQRHPYEGSDYRKYELAKSLLQKVPGVADVSFSRNYPGMRNFSSSNVDYRDKSIMAYHGSMDYNYLPFMGAKLLAGRFISPERSTDSVNSAIVNETFVRDMGWTMKDALGRQVEPGFDTIKYNVVGIIKDFNYASYRSKIEPVIFFHYKQSSWNKYFMPQLMVKLKSDDIPATLKRIKQLFNEKLEPGYPFDYKFLDKAFADTYKKYTAQQKLLTGLNGVVLLVALLGLFALSSFMIEQRLKEVAIRKTLGADSKTLVMSLTRQYLLIALIAVILSIPVSWYLMTKWLNDFAYRIDMPWWPYVLSLVVLLLLTFLVAGIRSYTATRVNLVKYLKYE